MLRIYLTTFNDAPLRSLRQIRASVMTLTTVALLGAATGCGRSMDQSADRNTSTSTVAASWQALHGARVFFAHQSVGENIVEGLTTLRHEAGPNQLPIVELKDMAARPDPAGAVFIHARLGRNGDPGGKTAAFVETLERGLGRQLDVAFQKYCFVDIDTSTDVKTLFEHYRVAMARVRGEFPALTVVHVTTPLMRVQSGPRAIVKKWLGRTPDYYEDNLARWRFNELMRHEYAGREPVFDLAALEASRPGGAPEPIAFGNASVFTLRPEYTDDGAHLNADARRRVASELLGFLARTVEARQRSQTSTRSE